MTLLKSLRKFAASENGATMVEYGLIVGLLSLVVIAAVTASGDSLKVLFETVSTSLSGAASQAGS
jgi:pilus assembly protein Flp/PilA